MQTIELLKSASSQLIRTQNVIHGGDSFRPHWEKYSKLTDLVLLQVRAVCASKNMQTSARHCRVDLVSFSFHHLSSICFVGVQLLPSYQSLSSLLLTSTPNARYNSRKLVISVAHLAAA